MHRCRHSVLIAAIQHAAGPIHTDFGAQLTCTRTLFNCLAPRIGSTNAGYILQYIVRACFAVYRLADTFRFSTTVTVYCRGWPASDLRRMLAEEIDVVQRVVLGDAEDEHLDIAPDLPHLNSIELFSAQWSYVLCAPLARLFQQTTKRALRRSIAVAVRRYRSFSQPDLFAPLLLDALLGAETADEFHDFLVLARSAFGFPRQHEVDQYMALLSDYKNNFTASTNYSAPLGVYIADAAVELHAGQAVPFDFEPFFKYIWNKYYATGLIDELVEDRKRASGPGEKPFVTPYELGAAEYVVRTLFDGMMMDAAFASRGDFCTTVFFEKDVCWYVNDLFADERFGNATSRYHFSSKLYDRRVVALCCGSFMFASELSKRIFDFGWCGRIRIWAEERTAHTTRLIHQQGVDRATAARIAIGTEEEEDCFWDSILDARMIVVTLLFGSKDLLNPPRNAVEATQKLLRDIFDEANERDDARLIPAFTAVLKAIFLMPPDERRDDSGRVVRTISVLERDRVKEIFTFLTHAARRERMRIKLEHEADDSNNARRRSREQSEKEKSNNRLHRRYLPRLLEDNHLRELMEQEAVRGTAVVKELLDELVSEEVIEI